jgi:hypothetical protein
MKLPFFIQRDLCARKLAGYHAAGRGMLAVVLD